MRAAASLGLALALAMMFDDAATGAVLGLVLGLLSPELVAGLSRATDVLALHARTGSVLVSMASLLSAAALSVGLAFIVTVLICRGATRVCGLDVPSISPLAPALSEQLVSETRARIPDTAVATWAHSATFTQLQSLVASVQLWEPDMHIVVWDMGLSPAQAQSVACGRHVRMEVLSLGQYPRHLAEHGGVLLQPVLIERTLQEHHAVVWLDPSVELVTPLHRARTSLLQHGGYFVSSTDVMADVANSIATHLALSPRTYRHKPVVSSSALAWVRDSEAYQSVLLPAIECVADLKRVGPAFTEASATSLVSQLLSALVYKASVPIEQDRHVLMSDIELLTQGHPSITTAFMQHTSSWLPASAHPLHIGECPGADVLTEMQQSKSAAGPIEHGSAWRISSSTHAYHVLAALFHVERARAASSWLFWCTSSVLLLVLIARIVRAPLSSQRR